MRVALKVCVMWLAVLAVSATGCGGRQVLERHSAPAAAGRGMVATVHPLATQAALDAMERGGNAVDAAVAAALTLGVVDGFNSGIGGGCFIVIRTADGKVTAIDGRETAPAAATRDMFIRNGQPDTELSQTGPLAVATPGALAAYALAVQRHGNLQLVDLLLPAADIAGGGFVLDAHYAQRLAGAAPKLARFDGARKIFFRPDGAPLNEGDTLIQQDLADTYRSIAVEGVSYFYGGAFAERLGRWMSTHGGILMARDLAEYQPKIRRPVISRYHDCMIVGFPPPSSGGVHVAQILNILEHFDLAAMHRRDPALFTHTVAEAMKLAFADRAYWLGDPAFADVPRGLIDRDYARQLARRIHPDRATPVESHGQPPGSSYFSQAGGLPARPRSSHTTHIATADRAGNWVAITATINTTFGSGIVVPGTGVVLNNQMDDFAIAPGVPNAFGLVGAEANSVEPGKRPLSSMSPTIVIEDGRPVLTVGAAGGPRIISQVVLTILRYLDLKMPIEEAIAAPRFHHQWRPDILYVEPSLPPAIRAALEQRGHQVQAASQTGVTQAIAYDRKAELFIGVSDPRVPGQAAGR